ncbi:cyclic peptide export ABC transporter [Pedobacter sp. KACC 23697]|uniref:Cyclic peptide export ABC transporter n=1 Tax=Pedobacter sp. KACC 23697 TaxID=3149230 RepID=A0AAU7K8G0_9SPHI
MRRVLKIVLPLIGKSGFLKYVILGILSGLFSFLFINAVNRVIGLLIAGRFTSIQKEYIIAFASIILLFIWIRRTLAVAIINLSQKLFWTLRKEILSTVLKASFQQLSAKRVKIHSAILSDVHILTDASMNIITFATSLVLAIACLGYLASLSMVLFVITLAISLMGVSIYHFSTRKNNQQFEASRSLENEFIDNFNAILDGFKEIYMEPKKGRYIYDKKIDAISKEAYYNNTTAFTGFLNNQITGQVLFYVLISSVLLFFSIILKIPVNNTVSFIFTLLYLLGSIETVMVLLPSLMRARIASNHLMDLQKELAEEEYEVQGLSQQVKRDAFESIAIKDLEYHYSATKTSFGIGPVNFQVNKGDTVFIYGGNGSGKTTFIHNMLGLITPSDGQILLNNVPVTSERYASYRAVFSVVFSDFYLFNELIGIDHFNEDRWAYYLNLFEMEHKVKIENKCFSTTDLSTGQRKRLALIAALMEEKPVLVIDEWAADQDPYFREKFYTKIIPLLKAEGLTIIAITHDDKYYYCADKLYKMDYGKLIKEEVDIEEVKVVSRNSDLI